MFLVVVQKQHQYVTQVSGQWVPKHWTGYRKGPTTICCKPVRWWDYEWTCVVGDGLSSVGGSAVCCPSQTVPCLHVYDPFAIQSSSGCGRRRDEVATRYGCQQKTSIYLCYWLELYVHRASVVYRWKSQAGDLLSVCCIKRSLLHFSCCVCVARLHSGYIGLQTCDQQVVVSTATMASESG